jgi:hypothetical protein
VDAPTGYVGLDGQSQALSYRIKGKWSSVTTRKAGVDLPECVPCSSP